MIGIANPSNPLCDRFNHYNVLMFCNSAGWSRIVQQDEWHWKVSGGEVEGVEFQHRKLWRVRDAQRCTWQHVLLKIYWIGSFTLLDNLLFKAPQYSDIKTIQDKQSYIISTLNSLSDMHILCTSARLLKLDFQHARRKCTLWVINIKTCQTANMSFYTVKLEHSSVGTNKPVWTWRWTLYLICGDFLCFPESQQLLNNGSEMWVVYVGGKWWCSVCVCVCMRANPASQNST